jgi:four helix bundle protein
MKSPASSATACIGSPPAIHRHDRDLADQAHRAPTSVVLNRAEGARMTGGNQRRHYEIAHGSANELRAAIDLAIAWGWIEEPTQVLELLDREMALLWKLTHPKQVPRGARQVRSR